MPQALENEEEQRRSLLQRRVKFIRMVSREKNECSSEEACSSILRRSAMACAAEQIKERETGIFFQPTFPHMLSVGTTSRMKVKLDTREWCTKRRNKRVRIIVMCFCELERNFYICKKLEVPPRALYSPGTNSRNWRISVW